MRYIYFGTIFATTIIFLLLSILLFIRRKEGERSRSILSAIMFISFLNYLDRLLNFNSPGLFDVMPVDILMLKVFLITTFIMYPIEVISPKWLTIKRIPLLYIPVLIISLAYKTCLYAGLGFNSYTSSNDLFASDASFDIICRLGLIVLIFIPIVLLYFLPYTSKYSNTNNKWIRRYVIAISITAVSFLVTMFDNNIWLRIIHHFIVISCSLYITYQEIFVRLIHNPIDYSHLTNFSLDSACSESINQKRNSTDNVLENQFSDELELEMSLDKIFEKMDSYLNYSKEWRNPDLMPENIADILGYNEQAINKVLEQYGFPNYDYYINGKRIQDFIKLVENRSAGSYQQLLFEVGFRCKNTAIKYFKEYTGQTPVEYFSFFR